MKGRSDDMIILKGVNIFPIQIETILLQFKELGSDYLYSPGGCLRVTVSRSDSENEENNGYTDFRRTGGNHLNRSRFSARRRRMVQFDG